jgi:hypothetical protein
LPLQTVPAQAFTPSLCFSTHVLNVLKARARAGLAQALRPRSFQSVCNHTHRIRAPLQPCRCVRKRGLAALLRGGQLRQCIEEAGAGRRQEVQTQRMLLLCARRWCELGSTARGRATDLMRAQ